MFLLANTTFLVKGQSPPIHNEHQMIASSQGTVAEWQNRRFCHAEIRVILDKK